MTQPVMRVAEVATAIAALTIRCVATGGANKDLVIWDLDQMRAALTDRDCPVLGPSSHEPPFLTEWDARRMSLQGNMQNSYTLNYKLFQAPVGQDRGLFAQYPVMIENARRVAEALQALTRVDGCKSIMLQAMPQFGPVVDASGQQFHGATFALRIVEF